MVFSNEIPLFDAATVVAWVACLLLSAYFCRLRKKGYLWLYLAIVALTAVQLLQLWQNWDLDIPDYYFSSFQSVLQIIAAVLVAGGLLSSD
ncbi:hypothetical protein H0O03_03235 [Candidatus Micrarchaeota archaeon]|nr:hypothetical protein [Candidatus Micrarchaeota archaeon]